MGQHDGKRAVITGGTSGIGYATAKLPIAQGGRALVTGRAKTALALARKELGKDAIVIESDAASLADIDALADRVKSEFGTLDLLFVNAGQTGFVPFDSMTEAVYDQLLAVNAKGAYFVVQKLAPLMSEGSAVVKPGLLHEFDPARPRGGQDLRRLLGPRGAGMNQEVRKHTALSQRRGDPPGVGAAAVGQSALVVVAPDQRLSLGVTNEKQPAHAQRLLDRTGIRKRGWISRWATTCAEGH